MKQATTQARALLMSSSGYLDMPYLEQPKPFIQAFLKDLGLDREEILFLPFAGIRQGFDAYEKRVKDILELDIASIHKKPDMKEALKSAKVVIAGGGNTFALLHDLYKYGLIELLQERCAKDLPFLGWSAGANIGGLGIFTTNDMPIIAPASFKAIGVLKAVINPHFISGKAHPLHNGETREERLEEYLLLNQDASIYALNEGSSIEVKGLELKINGPALLFRHKQEPKALEQGIWMKH